MKSYIVSGKILPIMLLFLLGFFLIVPTASAQSGTATVNTGALNVRSGPGISYSIEAVVLQGHVVTLLGRNSNSSWAFIRTGTGVEGWVNASFITPTVSIASLPVVAASSPTLTATITTGAANIRSGPGVTYSVLTVASYGQAVDLIGRNGNGSWVKVRLPSGQEGWVNASLITAYVTISSLPVVSAPAQPEPPVPVAPGAVLNLRSGPGFNFPVTGTVYQGLRVTAVGRNAASTWIKVRLSDGQEGWIGAQYVQLSTPINNLPIMDGTTTPPPGGTPTGTATATIATGVANIRNGPGIGYAIVATAPQGHVVTLLGRNNLSSWAKVRLANGTEGWVKADLISPNVAISSLPIIAVPTLTAAAFINTGALNVRSGPGIEFGVTAIAYQYETVGLLGRNANSSWVKIRQENGHVGWVNAAYIQANTTINSLPITN